VIWKAGEGKGLGMRDWGLVISVARDKGVGDREGRGLGTVDWEDWGLVTGDRGLG